MNVIPWNGEPISKPGLYAGVSMERYHSGRLCVGPSISSSGLRTIFSKSPAHFYDRWPLNPEHDPDADEESEAFILGRATHHLLLGEPRFAAEYAVRPAECIDAKGVMGPWQGNKTGAKKWLADRAAEGRAVLTEAQLERIKGMALSLSKQPLVRAGTLNGLIETTMAWIDGETGIWLLNRPDVIPTASADIVDLKTTTSVSYPDIVKTIGDYGYAQQGALVAEGYEAITGQKIASFSLYFVESKRPYCSLLYRLDDEDMELGHRQNRWALRQFIRCFNASVWPGPGGEQERETLVKLSTRQREIAEGRMRTLFEKAGRERPLNGVSVRLDGARGWKKEDDR
jgi:hypothetical protein